MSKCLICKGEGWVCESHPDRAWNESGCMCGAGMNCDCNPNGDMPSGIVLLASVDPIEQAAIDTTKAALKKARED